MTKPRILIATAPFGNGHLQAANTLKAAFEAHGCEVMCYDSATELHPYITRMTQDGYKQMYRTWLHSVYKFSYNFVGTPPILPISRFVLRTGRVKPAMSQIKAFNADAVIGTFPVPDFFNLAKTQMIDIPVYMLITDYTAHPLWFDSHVKRYFIADERIKQMVPKKLAGQNLDFEVTGIPIRPQFEETPDVEKVYTQYGMNPDHKHILFMAGANNVMPNFGPCLETVLENEGIDVIFISGRNKSLQNKIDLIADKYPGRVVSLGYVDKVADIYHAVDVVITKPGGITVSELAMTRTPAIFIRPLPGQEGDNAEFFTERGATQTVKTALAASTAAVRLVSNPEKLLEMQNAYDTLRHPHASEAIVKSVLNDIKNEKSK